METEIKDRITSLRWSIADAKDALLCAAGMRAWDNVIKYANQIKNLEFALYNAERVLARFP
jgi:hypothetical protein